MNPYEFKKEGIRNGKHRSPTRVNQPTKYRM